MTLLAFLSLCDFGTNVAHAATGTTATVTSVSISSSHNPSGFGELVVFNATVTSGTGTPTGTVEFFDGTASLGSATLDTTGAASLSMSSLAAGTHNVTAQYSGDAIFAPSTSGVLTEVVTVQGTTTLALSTANPVEYGQPVVFIVIVSANSGSAIPTGSVTVRAGSVDLGTVALDSTGQAAVGSSTLDAGDYNVTAAYSGDGNLSASTSGGLTETITQAPTILSLTSPASSSTFGAPLTLTATITPGSGTTATGSVEFSDGSIILGTAPVSGNQATFTTSTLAPGTHTLSASYRGDVNFTGSNATLTQSVGTVATTVRLSSSANPAILGAPVTFTATVTDSGTNAPATGQVALYDGETVLGTETLSNGTAAFTTSSLAAGSHTITATFAGSATEGPATSAALIEVIGVPATTTSLASSLNPSTVGQTVTFTATVTSPNGIPTGTVTLSDGSQVLGSIPLTAGVASTSVSTLAAGTHSVTAAYNGAGLFGNSTSSPLLQTVNAVTKIATSTTLTSSEKHPRAGKPLTLTAHVTSATGTPSGAVVFFDRETQIGTALLSAGGDATLALAGLDQGHHQLTAVYQGSANFAPSTSPVLHLHVRVGDQHDNNGKSNNQNDPSAGGANNQNDNAAGGANNQNDNAAGPGNDTHGSASGNQNNNAQGKGKLGGKGNGQ